jgi:hypothetical protein
VLAASGCDGASLGDDLTLTPLPQGSGPLLVDHICNPQCGGSDKVDLRLQYRETVAVQQGRLEFRQYRVDFVLPGVAGNVPFFAAPSRFDVNPGDNKVQPLTVVGQAQREFVRQAVGDVAVLGTAYLTLAGYDAEKRQIYSQTSFPVRFGDERAATSTNKPVVDGGGGDAGD